MMARLAICLLTSIFLFSETANGGLVRFGSGVNEFSMEFVQIGNPGNEDDTTGSPNPAGRVDYTYRMGKHEVSEGMIAKANALGNLGLTTENRGLNKPATTVSWSEAARFVNWLNTSQGFQAAYNFPTNPGDAGYDPFEPIALWSSAESWQVGGENRFRHKHAHFFLPNTDEWYKAAYYDAVGARYFDFPTGSDVPPTAVASGTAFGTAVYSPSAPPNLAGPADITEAGGLSPYGTMGQGGNVTEWEETTFDLTNASGYSERGVRGGQWGLPIGLLSASVRSGARPERRNQYGQWGIRVASIPEPSAASYGCVVMLGLLCWKRMRGS